ncbi:MAG: YjbH domain-containing protein [Candidatus Wallacebacter cryptica]|jgi:hypothetical protein|nr:YjbH domain-containing protein [Bacillota bacterium]
MHAKSHKLLLVLICVLIIGLSSITASAHNIYGSTGLINIPTASIMPSGSVGAAFHQLRGGGHFSVVLGAFPGVEVGLASHFKQHSQTFSGSVKVQILQEQDYPAVAVGLTTDGSQASYYLVGSMQLGIPGVRGHLGFGSGRYSRGFAGISSVLNPVSIVSSDRKFTVPVTSLLVELDGTGLNAGVSLKFNQTLDARLMLMNFDSLGLGISYSHRF